MAGYYKLNPDKSISPCSIRACFQQREDMRVDGTKFYLNDYIKGKRVGTGWLGINQELDENKPPLVFETIIFDENRYMFICLYESFLESQKGHEIIVRLIREEIIK